MASLSSYARQGGILSCLLALSQSAQAATAPSFELHPGLEMHLYAAEPDVVDPVALTFDAQGRCFVVEMRDYPLGVGPGRRPGGTIRMLVDTNHDGRVDQSTLFAEGLSFPTSILAWNGGMLVAAPPEILFLKDTNSDGKADVREVVVQGFKLGVTDSNLSGLRWGLDNRIHGVNGGNGGRLASPKAPERILDLKDSDFSLDPLTRDIQRSFPTSGGFGLVFDDWGHRFGTYNINHIQQQVLASHYLEGATHLFPVEGTVSISDHGDMARIYPLSQAETRVNHPEQAGYFSSAGGLGFIGMSSYPGDLPGSVTVCDVVGNLIHRDLLVEDGPIYRATRSKGEIESEFFASRDSTCRPVGLELGPDGALYLLDMQRDVIEHPDYIPRKVKARLDLRAGEDRGRIYRITPKGGLPLAEVRADRLSSKELLPQLGDGNPWWRFTAQRLLVERGDGRIESALRNYARIAGTPKGRLHAYWTLQGLKRLRAEDLNALLTETHPGLVENALQIAELHPADLGRIRGRVLAALDHAHPRVRFQAALTVGRLLPEDKVANVALRRLWKRDLVWRWSRVAALIGLRQGASELLNATLIDQDLLAREPTVLKEGLKELAYVVGRQWTSEKTKSTEALLRELNRSYLTNTLRAAVLEGLGAGLPTDAKIKSDTAGLNSALEALLDSEDPEVIGAVLELTRRWGLSAGPRQQGLIADALSAAANPQSPPTRRSAQIRLLNMADPLQAQPVLLNLLRSSEPPEVQTAAWGVLKRSQAPDVATVLLSQWRTLSPRLRPEIVQALSYRKAWHDSLLKALETSQIHPGEISLDLEQRRQLLRHASTENQKRAARFFSDEEYSNRKQLVDDWLVKLPRSGDAARGREVFARLCAPCHQVGTLGSAVGPTLTAQGHRSVEDLVSNILDPNMALNPSFVSVQCETRDGEMHIGLLDSESASAVVLRQPQGTRLTLDRSQIVKMEFTGNSLMPEGLESSMTPQDLRDVVAFLQAPDQKH